MNVDVRILFTDGERAARRGDFEPARMAFLEAGRAATAVQLWRAAIRCYRHALELDLRERGAVEAILQMPARVISGRGWDGYRTVLDQHPEWPRFSCRSARVVSGNLGTVIECPGAGAVLELMMTERDLIELRPDSRFRAMPIAMAMIVLRRALWPLPREHETDSMRVIYGGRERVRLDELGDWEPIVRDR